MHNRNRRRNFFYQASKDSPAAMSAGQYRER